MSWSWKKSLLTLATGMLALAPVASARPFYRFGYGYGYGGYYPYYWGPSLSFGWGRGYFYGYGRGFGRRW